MILLSGISLFIAWSAATYFLEGRKRTLLRPEATRDRLIYAIVANMLIGTLGPALLVHLNFGRLDGFLPGVPSSNNMLLSIAAAFTLGLLLLIVQRPPSWNPVVLLNGFSQTLVVSIAEVLVCWAILGSTIASACSPAGRILSITAGLFIASIAFGVYHFAHSPPFNTLKMVAVLTVVGFITGMFFFLSRNVYATIVFHNFLALKGVTESLSKAGLLERYQRIQIPLISTSSLAIVFLICADIFL